MIKEITAWAAAIGIAVAGTHMLGLSDLTAGGVLGTSLLVAGYVATCNWLAEVRAPV